MNQKVFHRFYGDVSSYEGLAVGWGPLYNQTMPLERLVWLKLLFTVSAYQSFFQWYFHGASGVQSPVVHPAARADSEALERCRPGEVTTVSLLISSARAIDAKAKSPDSS